MEPDHRNHADYFLGKSPLWEDHQNVAERGELSSLCGSTNLVLSPWISPFKDSCQKEGLAGTPFLGQKKCLKNARAL